MYEYAIKEIVKVVDGDTIDIVIDLGFNLSKKERVRLAGIDSPESRTKDLEEKELGLESKEFLNPKTVPRYPGKSTDALVALALTGGKPT